MTNWPEASIFIAFWLSAAVMVHSCCSMSKGAEPEQATHYLTTPLQACELCDRRCREVFGVPASDVVLAGDGSSIGCHCGGRKVGQYEFPQRDLWYDRDSLMQQKAP